MLGRERLEISANATTIRRAMSPPVDPRDFVESMTLAVRQAAAAVRWLEGRVRNRPKAGEITPEKKALTDGDCVSQEVLLVALLDRYPEVALNVEEDTPTVARFPGQADDLVVIDPIDGTLRYLRGDGRYAILVGLERQGRVEAMLAAIPQLDVVIRSARGGGTEISRGDAPFEAVRAADRGSEVYVSYGLDPDVGRRLDAGGAKRVTAAGAAIACAPLLDDACGGLRVMATPEGLSRRAWVAALATLEAGGAVEGLEGEFPEVYRPGVPVLIAAPSSGAAAELRSSLAPAG
jgi:myo-inositol-1(or 4)-monophosphatase